MLSGCFPFIISYCILHHTRIQTALCLPSLCTALRPIKLPERIVIKELLDNYTSIRPPHDKLRISNKSRSTPPLFSRCSTIPLEKLTFFHLIRQTPHLMEKECSLPHSQVLATCPYPEPNRLTQYHNIALPEDPA